MSLYIGGGLCEKNQKGLEGPDKFYNIPYLFFPPSLTQQRAGSLQGMKHEIISVMNTIG